MLDISLIRIIAIGLGIMAAVIPWCYGTWRRKSCLRAMAVVVIYECKMVGWFVIKLFYLCA